MTMKNKKLSVLFLSVVLVLISLLFGTPVLAATDSTITIKNTKFEADQGTTFSTTIYIEEGSGTEILQTKLLYDVNKLTLVAATPADDSGAVINAAKEGSIILSWASMDGPVTEKTNIVTLEFQVDETLSEGEYNFLSIDPTFKSAGGNDEVSVDVKSDFTTLSIYGYGDVNLNHEVDTMDALRAIKSWLGTVTLSPVAQKYGDVNFDSEVDTLDALAIQRYYVGLRSTLGSRVNITFYNADGSVYIVKSITVGTTLSNIPDVPTVEGFSNGRWSANPDEDVKPNYTEVQDHISVYAIYDKNESQAMEFYKERLTRTYYSESVLAGHLSLVSNMDYQGTYSARIYWESSNNATLNATTGVFSQPTYDSNVQLIATIVSYNDGMIEDSSELVLDYKVEGLFDTPTKDVIANYLQSVIGTSITSDLRLPQKVTNSDLGTIGASMSPFEVRVSWAEVNEKGEEQGITQITRSTTAKVTSLVATITFNGVPLEDDGKVYFDDVSLTAITQEEVRNHIIKKIAENMTLSITTGDTLWSDENDPYHANVQWITGNSEIATVASNEVTINGSTINGTSLPLVAQVTYPAETELGTDTFELYYTFTAVNNSVVLVPGTNIDPSLYDALRDALDVNGGLTTDSLKANTFVYLDLSGYPDIKDLTGLSYCINLRVLNISGLRVEKGFNQIATLNKLEALIASDCGLSTLSEGGVPVLKNAIDLKMLDLSYNSFTSLESVFDDDVIYHKLSEVYLQGNQLDDISSLENAPLLSVLSLADNGLSSEDLSSVTNFKFLKYLSISDNEIDSLESLKNMTRLEELRAQNNQISDLSALRLMKRLKALYLGNNNISCKYTTGGTETNVRYLSYLTNLEVLYLNENQIDDTEVLQNLTKLKALNISNNMIQSLASISNNTNLIELYAENNEIESFNFIQKLTGLKKLMLSGNTGTYESSINDYLSNLKELETLTLSGKKLKSLSFLSNMSKLVRLEISDCGLASYNITEASVDGDTLKISGYEDNVAYLLTLKNTIKYLDISNNGFAYKADDILDYLKTDGITYSGVKKIAFSGSTPILFESLYELSKLVVFYCDNMDVDIDANGLLSLMTSLEYVSMENCGIRNSSWLTKYKKLKYLDLAQNEIEYFDFSYIDERCRTTLTELYLDVKEGTQAVFGDSNVLFDENILQKLSLSNMYIESMDFLPTMEKLQELNISGTGLTSLSGSDEIYGLGRFTNLSTLNVSHLDVALAPIVSIDHIETVYAVGSSEESVFYRENLLALYNMYNAKKTVYLYDENTVYTPVAADEGTEILALLPDISCDIKVAADNMLSDNNPLLTEQINDFDITWSVSNSVNYEIVNNRLSVKDYSGIEDETLIITALITVYPDQAPVTRKFKINTNILRASADYIDIKAVGYSKQLTRDKQFTYNVTLKAVQTDGFTNPVKPVEDNIAYKYEASAANGTPLSYIDVLILDEDGNYSITSDAPLGAITTITVAVTHTDKDGNVIDSIEPIVAQITVVSRTFTVTTVLNGGTLTDVNNANHDSFECVEDSLIFDGLTVQKTGYLFEGWYLDEALTQLYSIDGVDAKMPSENITLYAKWKAHSFNLKFDANGGTVSETSRLVLCDTAVGTLPTPQRTGYTFGGWFTSDGKQISASTTMATATDITVTAKWTVNSYKVSWNTGTGYTITVKRTSSPLKGASTGNLSNGETIYYGDVISVSYTANTGYSLGNNGRTSITVAGNVTASDIYASASVNSYKVSWNTGTGYTIAVKRTSSPLKGASTGTINSGATIYYGDVLSVSYTASTGYSIASKGSTSITVTGNVTSSNIYATASLNSYTYKIVYKSSNGTNLGSTTATYKYGTTNTISAPAVSGYDAPGPQTVVWDSTTAKTITFIYTPSYILPLQRIAEGWWWQSGSSGITYAVNAEYRNRTANSVEIRIAWIQNISNAAFGYNQYYFISLHHNGSVRGSTNTVKIASTSTWPYYSSSGPWHTGSVTAYSEWITVSLDTKKATTVMVACDWWTEGTSASGSWSEKLISIPAY